MSDSEFIIPAQHDQEEVLFDSGGTADCYKLIIDDHIYCVKRPKPQYRHSEAYLSLFRKEFEMGSELDHPNIVRYVAYGEDERGSYIRMNYVDGDNLEEFVAQHPDYFTDKTCRKRFCDELFSALAYIHGKGMLHLDLKPRNILITNQGHHVKLIDLGFGWSESRLHDLGFTRDYCAPEQQVAKTGILSAATDIYAMGKILQQFGLADDSVVHRCLKEDSKERFQSIGELQRAIKRSENVRTTSRIGMALAAVLIVGTVFFAVKQQFGRLQNTRNQQYTKTHHLPSPEGTINGLFTVNEAGDQVYFSQGNLQYQASTNTWRFAEHQWDYQGKANDSISPTYDGWIDLFGWGTSGYNHGAVYYQPWSENGVSSSYYAYGDWRNNLEDQTGQADWGYNAISNGGNTEGQWRTLKASEWKYVLYERNTASGIRYAKAVVNGVNGLILLPDDWIDTHSLDSTNRSGADFYNNVIDIARWSQMQDAGAVFLPTSGSRYWIVSWGRNFVGVYWSSTYYDGNSAYRLYIDVTVVNFDEAFSRSDAHAVRLVRDK